MRPASGPGPGAGGGGEGRCDVGEGGEVAGKPGFLESGVDVVAVTTGSDQALAKSIRLPGLHPHAGGRRPQFVAAHAPWPARKDPFPGGAEMAATPAPKAASPMTLTTWGGSSSPARPSAMPRPVRQSVAWR